MCLCLVVLLVVLSAVTVGIVLGVIYPRDVDMEVMMIEKQGFRVELNPLPSYSFTFKILVKATNKCYVNIDLKKIVVDIMYRNESIGVVTRNEDVTLLARRDAVFATDLVISKSGIAITQIILHMLNDIRASGKVKFDFYGKADVKYVGFHVTPKYYVFKEFTPINVTAWWKTWVKTW